MKTFTYSARQIPPVRARQMIEEGAKKALQDLAAVKPYVPAQPTTVTIELESVDKAAGFRGRHGVEIVEPLKVVSRGRDWMQAWDQVWHW
ncbi:MAG TPA: M55 family metallopeptidase [Anaerolineae bacterium]